MDVESKSDEIVGSQTGDDDVSEPEGEHGCAGDELEDFWPAQLAADKREKPPENEHDDARSAQTHKQSHILLHALRTKIEIRLSCCPIRI